MIVYLDSGIVMSLVENRPIWGPPAAARIAALRLDGHEFAVSDLTRLGCFVGPIRAGNAASLTDFRDYFSDPGVQTLALSPVVCDRAAEIRAMFGFKTPDALHLAAAVEAGCDLFVTHDRHLGRFTGLSIDVVS